MPSVTSNNVMLYSAFIQKTSKEEDMDLQLLDELMYETIRLQEQYCTTKAEINIT
jgi:hypothetical protein